MLQYLILMAPGLLLAMWAQWRVQSAYASARQLPAPLSGAAAARQVLDSAGLQGVDIEMVPGHLSDHYDPRHKVLRLSPEVYQSRSLAAVGIAAHEAGHALQDAESYGPMIVRNAAVGAANFGSNISYTLILLGFLMQWQVLLLAGIAAFSCVVFFQVVNLPVEFNASTRAKRQLVELGIVDGEGLRQVKRVLSAAALTYVAATLTSVLTLLYYWLRFSGSRGHGSSS